MVVVSQSIMSYVYIVNPDLSMWQMVFWRAAFCLLITLAMMRGNVKQEMVTNVSREDIPRIAAFLILTAGVTVPLTMALKYFPASVVTAVLNLQPVFALILAFVILGERATLKDLVSIAVSLLSIFLIVNAQVRSDLQGMAEQTIDNSLTYKVALVGLISCPLLASLCRVVVKQMWSVSPFAMAAYLNLTLLSASAIGLASISITWVVFVLIALTSAATVLMKVTRFIAIKHLTTNRMSVFM